MTATNRYYKTSADTRQSQTDIQTAADTRQSQTDIQTTVDTIQPQTDIQTTADTKTATNRYSDNCRH